MPSKSISLPDALYAQLLRSPRAVDSARLCDLIRYGLELERLAALPTGDERASGVASLIGSIRSTIPPG